MDGGIIYKVCWVCKCCISFSSRVGTCTTVVGLLPTHPASEQVVHLDTRGDGDVTRDCTFLHRCRGAGGDGSVLQMVFFCLQL